MNDIYTDYQRVYFSVFKDRNTSEYKRTPEFYFTLETVSNGELEKHRYDIVYCDKELQSTINASSDRRLIIKENELTDWLVALYGSNYPIIDLKRDVIKKAVRDSLQIKYKVLLVKEYVNVYLKTVQGHIILREIATDDIYIIWNGLDNNNLGKDSYRYNCGISKYEWDMQTLFEYISNKIGDCGKWRDMEQVNVEVYDDYEHLFNSIPAGNGKVFIKDLYKDYMECEAPEKVRYAYKLQNSDIQDKEVVSQKMIDIEKGLETNNE